MVANDRQVGGKHYGEGSFKHWDWVATIGMQYHEGCATKHLARYDKKDEEIEDLEKTIHYLEKTIELAPLILLRLKMVRPNLDFVSDETERFCELNDVTGAAKQVMFLVAAWETTDDLRNAIEFVEELLEEEREIAKPVPLEDSNKHALQKQDD